MLDMHTMLIMNFIYNFLIGSIILFLHFSTPNRRGFDFIGLGLLLISFGSLLIAFRERLDPFTSVIVANSLVAIGLISATRGMREFWRKPKKMILYDLVVSLVLIILLYWWTYIRPDVNTRIILMMVIFNISLGELVYLLLNETEPSFKKVNLILSLSFILAIFVNMARLVWALLGSPMLNFMQAGDMHIIGSGIFQLVCINIALCIFWTTNLLMHKELEDQALTDGLTGLYNHSAWTELGRKEFECQQCYSQPLAIVMCDIDNFKRINDQYGHQAGDAVIKQIAQILETHVRSTDLVARYGGEEFSLTLRVNDNQSLYDVLEKLRAYIASLEIQYDNNIIKSTISIGGILITHPILSQVEAIRIADKALYYAKNHGKNQVILFDDDCKNVTPQ